MRLGVIDLGTNSVRFDVRLIDGGGRVQQLYHEKLMIRLGQNAFVEQRLDAGAIRRATHAFIKFRETADRLRVDKILAFGTAALREVHDREKFVERIRRRTGICIQVISGTEEAKLIALGVLANERIPKRRFALVDIGGGSTEVSLCCGGKAVTSASLPLGVARLQQVFLKRSPPAVESIAELRGFIRSTLKSQLKVRGTQKVKLIIGSSGTIRALAKLQKRIYGQKAISRKFMADLVKGLSRLDVEELRSVPGMEQKRADLILAGAILFEECMEALGAKKALPTQYSLRDGIIAEEVQLCRQGRLSHLSFHLEELYAFARSFGCSDVRLRRAVELSKVLFVRLRGIHGLGNKWQIYLQAALILRDIGEVISIARHPIHTYYILKHADLPPMEEWELELIAQLCLQHMVSKECKLNLSPLRKFKPVPAGVFPNLLAVLRLTDAFDIGTTAPIRIIRVASDRRRIRIFYSGRNLTGLEGLAIEKQKSFWKRTLSREISVRAV